MASRNPALNDKIFQREAGAAANSGFAPNWDAVATPGTTAGSTDTMRLHGTLSATGILLALVLVGGYFGWQAVELVTGRNAAGETVVLSTKVPIWIWGALIGAFVAAIVATIKPKLARILGPVYAIAEGVFLGAISHIYEVQYDGIVGQAIGLTIGVFFTMLVLFATGTVKVTDRMRTMVFAATGGIALVYLVSLVFRLFGAEFPLIHSSGAFGIGFSLLVVGIASMHLLLDFDFIQSGVDMRAPRYMEWYGALGLMISLVWLYLEILRLLSKLRER